VISELCYSTDSKVIAGDIRAVLLYW